MKLVVLKVQILAPHKKRRQRRHSIASSFNPCGADQVEDVIMHFCLSAIPVVIAPISDS